MFSRLQTYLAVAGLALLAAVDAWALPLDLRVPGGIAVVDLGAADHAPVVSADGARVAVTSENGRWYALIGIGLATRPGSHVHVTVAGKPQSLTVLPKRYPRESFQLADKRRSSPSADDLERIKTDQHDIARLKMTFSESLPPTFFIAPTAGAPSSVFGTERHINGIARRPHAGLDFRGALGAPVVAPADASVLYQGEQFFGGQTLWLDHGQGVISYYMHLSQMHVATGEPVKRGQRIADIGASGRATGPHLHWGVFMNGTAIDPALWLSNGKKP